MFLKNSSITGELPLKEMYDDTVHPAAVEIGKTIALPFQVISKLLAPLRNWATASQDNLDDVSKAVAEKVVSVPEEKLTSPELYVAVPAFQAISYSMDNNELKNMYANLLAKSIVKDTKDKVHPAYVEIIKQMSPLDAVFLKEIYGNELHALPICGIRLQKKYASPSATLTSFRYFREGVDIVKNLTLFSDVLADTESIAESVDNLSRLNLIETERSKYLTNDECYKKFEDLDIVKNYKLKYDPILKDNADLKDMEIALVKGVLNITNLGSNFVNICLSDLFDLADTSVHGVI